MRDERQRAIRPDTGHQESVAGMQGGFERVRGRSDGSCGAQGRREEVVANRRGMTLGRGDGDIFIPVSTRQSW